MHAVCCARPKELQADVESDARPLLPPLPSPPRHPPWLWLAIVFMSRQVPCELAHPSSFSFVLTFRMFAHLWICSQTVSITCFTWVLYFCDNSLELCDCSVAYAEVCLLILFFFSRFGVCHYARELVVVDIAHHAGSATALVHISLFPFTALTHL